MAPRRNYHWLFLTEGPDRDMRVVPFGTKCELGECHGLLDPAENYDADQVDGSNETYDYFAGDADATHGSLLRRQLPCSCLPCRSVASI